MKRVRVKAKRDGVKARRTRSSGSKGKQKGSAFERKICVRLSKWVSGGKDADLFWRSAMSGGRATVSRKKGVKLSRQAGDICAVAPEGHVLTNIFYVELKAYRDLSFISFFLAGSAKLAKFWQVACREAQEHGRIPLLIAKQNNAPILAIVPRGTDFNGRVLMPQLRMFGGTINADIHLLDELLKEKVWKHDPLRRIRL